MKTFQIGVILKAIDKLSGPFKASTAAISDFQKQAKLSQNNAKAIMGTTGWKVAAAGATATAAAIGLSVKAYGNLASAQGEIRSLGIGAEGIEKITKAAKEFSNNWSGTTAQEFISASYDIKSGISSLGDTAVGEFTRIAALTGKATKSTTAEMTSLFATGYGIYRSSFDTFGAEYIKGWEKLSAEEKDIKFGEYFSGGISSAVKQFKTNGPQMAEAMSNLGSSATAVGVSFSEQLAILGQAQAVYKGGSEAASGYRTFLAGVAKAQTKLGLSFSDKNGNMKSFVDIIGELKKKYGDTISVAESAELSEAFGGTEAVKFINTFYNKTGELTSNIEYMNKAVQQGTTVTTEMAKAFEGGPNEQAKILAQRVQNLASSLGKNLFPSVGKGIGILSGGVLVLNKFVDRFPKLSSGILLAAGAFLSLAAAIPLIGAYIPMFKAGIEVIKSITLVTKIWTGVQAALNAVMAGNPVAWIIIGVIALAVAAFLLIKNWKKVSAFFSGLWTGIVKVFKRGWDAVWKALDSPLIQALLTSFLPVIGLPVIIIKNWKAISSFFTALWSGIASAAKTVWGGIASFFGGIWSKIKSAADFAWNAITGFIKGPIGSITKVWTEVSDFFSGLWDEIKNAAGSAWDWISSKILSVWNAIKSPFEAVKEFFGLSSAPAPSTSKPSSSTPAPEPRTSGLPFKTASPYMYRMSPDYPSAFAPAVPSGTPSPSGAPFPTGTAMSGSTTNTRIEKQELVVRFDNAPKGTKVDPSKKSDNVDFTLGYASGL